MTRHSGQHMVQQKDQPPEGENQINDKSTSMVNQVEPSTDQMLKTLITLIQMQQEMLMTAVRLNLEAASRRLAIEFQKLKPPTYSGSGDAFEFDDWIIHLEACFRVTQCTDKDKMLLAPFQLKGIAQSWWVSQMEELQHTDWDNFKLKITDRFVPSTVRRQLRTAFLMLKQGNKTVSEYMIDFTRLMKYAASCVSTEAEKICQFREGLRHSIRLFLFAPSICTMTDALNMALEVEMNEQDWKKEYAKGKRIQHDSKDTNDGRPVKIQKIENNTENHKNTSNGRVEKERSCYVCKKVGHIQAECWFLNKDTKKCEYCKRYGHSENKCRTKTAICTNCRGMGHFANNCAAVSPTSTDDITAGSYGAETSGSGQESPEFSGIRHFITENEEISE